MTDLQEAISQVFAPDGALTKTIDGFQSRASQVEFSLAVANALVNRQSVLVAPGPGPRHQFR